MEANECVTNLIPIVKIFLLIYFMITVFDIPVLANVKSRCQILRSQGLSQEWKRFMHYACSI